MPAADLTRSEAEVDAELDPARVDSRACLAEVGVGPRLRDAAVDRIRIVVDVVEDIDDLG